MAKKETTVIQLDGEINLKADKAKQSMQELKNLLNEFKNKTIDVKAQTRSARMSIQNLGDFISRTFNRENVVKLSTADAQVKADKLLSTLRSFKDVTKISISLDAKGVSSQLQSIRNDLNFISGKHTISLNVTTTQVKSQLASLSKDINNIKNVSFTVNVRNNADLKGINTFTKDMSKLAGLKSDITFGITVRSVKNSLDRVRQVSNVLANLKNNNSIQFTESGLNQIIGKLKNMELYLRSIKQNSKIKIEATGAKELPKLKVNADQSDLFAVEKRLAIIRAMIRQINRMTLKVNGRYNNRSGGGGSRGGRSAGDEQLGNRWFNSSFFTQFVHFVGRSSKGFGSFGEATADVLAKWQAAGGALGKFASVASVAAAGIAAFSAGITLVVGSLNVFANILTTIGRTIYTALQPGIELYKQQTSAVFSFTAALQSNAKYLDKPLSRNDARGLSQDLINRATLDAEMSAFSLEELLRSLQGTLPILLSRGMSLDQAYEVNKGVAGVAKMTQLTPSQILQETRDLAQGSITSRGSQVANALGITNADINKYKGDVEGLYNFLMEKFANYSELLQQYEDTALGRYQQLEERWQSVTKTLVDGVADQFKGVFEYLINATGQWVDKEGNILNALTGKWEDAQGNIFNKDKNQWENPLGEVVEKSVDNVGKNPVFQLSESLQKLIPLFQDIVNYTTELVDGFTEFVSKTFDGEDPIKVIKEFIFACLDGLFLCAKTLVILIDSFVDARNESGSWLNVMDDIFVIIYNLGITGVRGFKEITLAIAGVIGAALKLGKILGPIITGIGLLHGNLVMAAAGAALTGAAMAVSDDIDAFIAEKDRLQEELHKEKPNYISSASDLLIKPKDGDLTKRVRQTQAEEEAKRVLDQARNQHLDPKSAKGTSQDKEDEKARKKAIQDSQKMLKEEQSRLKRLLEDTLEKLKDILEKNEVSYKEGFTSIEEYFKNKTELERQQAEVELEYAQKELEAIQKSLFNNPYEKQKAENDVQRKIEKYTKQLNKAITVQQEVTRDLGNFTTAVKNFTSEFRYAVSSGGNDINQNNGTIDLYGLTGDINGELHGNVNVPGRNQNLILAKLAKLIALRANSNNQMLPYLVYGHLRAEMEKPNADGTIREYDYDDHNYSGISTSEQYNRFGTRNKPRPEGGYYERLLDDAEFIMRHADLLKSVYPKSIMALNNSDYVEGLIHGKNDARYFEDPDVAGYKSRVLSGVNTTNKEVRAILDANTQAVIDNTQAVNVAAGAVGNVKGVFDKNAKFNNGELQVISAYRSPRNNQSGFHNGIDIAADTWTPVYAPANGVVSRSKEVQNPGGYGIVVNLDVDEGNIKQFRFGHLIDAVVKKGEQIVAGQLLGYVGDTGNASGGTPHLHMEALSVRDSYKVIGNTLDPTDIAFNGLAKYNNAQPIISTSLPLNQAHSAKASSEVYDKIQEFVDNLNTLKSDITEKIFGTLPDLGVKMRSIYRDIEKFSRSSNPSSMAMVEALKIKARQEEAKLIGDALINQLEFNTSRIETTGSYRATDIAYGKNRLYDTSMKDMADKYYDYYFKETDTEKVKKEISETSKLSSLFKSPVEFYDIYKQVNDDLYTAVTNNSELWNKYKGLLETRDNLSKQLGSSDVTAEVKDKYNKVLEDINKLESDEKSSPILSNISNLDKQHKLLKNIQSKYSFNKDEVYDNYKKWKDANDRLWEMMNVEGKKGTQEQIDALTKETNDFKSVYEKSKVGFDIAGAELERKLSDLNTQLMLVKQHPANQISDLIRKFSEQTNLGNVEEADKIRRKLFEIRNKFFAIVDSWVQAVNSRFDIMQNYFDALPGTNLQKERGNAELKSYRNAALAEANQVKLNKMKDRYFEIELTMKANKDTMDWVSKDETISMEERKQLISELVNENTYYAESLDALKQKMIDTTNEIRLNKELAKFPTLLRETRKAAKQALEDGLVTFLTDGVNEAENLGEALRNLAIDFLKTMQQFFAKRVVGDLMEHWFQVKTGDTDERTSTENLALGLYDNTVALNNNTNALLGITSSSFNNSLASANRSITLSERYGGVLSPQPSMLNLSYDQYQKQKSGDNYDFTNEGFGLKDYSKGWSRTGDNSAVDNFNISLEQASQNTDEFSGIIGTTNDISNNGGITTFGSNIESATPLISGLGTAAQSAATSLQSIFGTPPAPTKKASGGYITGPGTSTSDSIPAMLSNGEYVIKASSVRKYGTNFLNSVNNGNFAKIKSNVAHFAEGGLVETVARSEINEGMQGFALKQNNQPINNTANINVALVRDEAEGMRQLLKSPEGQRIMLDFSKRYASITSRF